MLTNLLSDLVCSYFTEKCPGDWQAKKEKKEGLLLQFSTTIAENEDGYRYRDLFIYGDHNYIGVYARRRWNVIPQDDLEYDDDGHASIKKGCDYTKGSDDWQVLSYHDSCWRGAVEGFFHEHGRELSVFKSIKLCDFPLQTVEVGGKDYDGTLATPTHEEMAAARKEKYGR